jgi:hypothetical protein
MQHKKPTTARTKKPEKGQQVFGGNADEVLAKKIIAHSKSSSGGKKAVKPAPDAAPKKPAEPKPAFTYRTPEEKHRTKTAGYGIVALVCLFVLGIITFLWSKLKKD